MGTLHWHRSTRAQQNFRPQNVKQSNSQKSSFAVRAPFTLPCCAHRNGFGTELKFNYKSRNINRDRLLEWRCMPRNCHSIVSKIDFGRVCSLIGSVVVARATVSALFGLAPQFTEMHLNFTGSVLHSAATTANPFL